MPISYVNSGTIGDTTDTSLSNSFDVGSGTDRLLVVTVYGEISGTNNITGMTFNGVALTKIGEVQNPTDRITSLWYLLNPASGSHTLTISASGSTKIAAIAATYNGVKQAASLQTSTTTTGTSVSTKTVSLTTSNSEEAIIAAEKNTWGATTAGANSVLRLNTNAQSFIDRITTSSDTIGSTSVIFNGAGSGNVGIVAGAFIPSSLSITATDTQTETEVISAVLAQVISVSDTQTESESTRAGYGFVDQSKSSTTWTDQLKS